VPLAGPLPPGPYKVAWHAVADDGHKTGGTFGFTLEPEP
jgi:copper resistance protein C